MAWLDAHNSRQAGLDRVMKRAARQLRARDPVLDELMRQFGPYDLHVTTNAFQVMLETIVSQQLSTHAARSIYTRLATAMGSRQPHPMNLLALSPSELIACGLSRSKAAYVRNVAEDFQRHRVTRRTFEGMSDEEVMARLTSIKGVGEWSAHMFLIFALNRLDVFPVGDLGLRNTMTRCYHLRRGVSNRRFMRIAEEWRPYRTVGTLYLWRGYDGV